MSRRRFFAPPDAFKQKTVTLTSDEAKHLRDVLRLKQGDEVYVFDGAGKEFRCVVSDWKRYLVTFPIGNYAAKFFSCVVYNMKKRRKRISLRSFRLET